MKQKDIIVIAVVVLVAAVVALVASKFVIRDSDKKQEAEIVQAISPTFDPPSAKFFNSTSLNPTQQIQIGDNTNTDPFKNPTGQ